MNLKIHTKAMNYLGVWLKTCLNILIIIKNIFGQRQTVPVCFLNCISGLLKTEHGKRNIERINEELDMIGDGYQKIQQFISDSPWDTRGLMTAIGLQTSTLYSEGTGYCVNDVGYIIDESAHLKKGTKSVGVARQYAGVIGKVENCQVGVYSSLVWQRHTSLVNSRLFLPESWTKDKIKCDIAGIPDDERAFKTKPQLALEMLKADVESGIKFG